MGLFSALKNFDNNRSLKKLEKQASKIEALADKYKSMSDEELKNQTEILKDRFKNGETLDDLLYDAYAVVRESATRVLNMRHFHVQLLGGIVLHQGRIAEMCTGEGKTLVSTLPAYLNAISGKPVHVVTVNEYLAKRDAEWMGKVHRFLGLSVGYIYTGQEQADKKKAYECDITYGTNSEFGFDYLRDNMCTTLDERVQRGLDFAVVDEVDSILIDEARTPLIISGPSGESSDQYTTAAKFAKTLKTDDVEIDEKQKTIHLTETGISKAERYYRIENLSDIENTEINHNINNAIRARFLMNKDEDYIVRDGEVLIVDEFTGRIMVGRRYSNGLHQAIEAKEGVKIQGENKTFATVTFQNFFKLYKKISGMTGTAKTEESEFREIYGLDVVTIPTNLPSKRKDENDVFFFSHEAKLNAICEDIKRNHAEGRPVLVGTLSVAKSEELAKLLVRQGIKHNVLNAKNHLKEAEIIAQAGRTGAVTIATNMAGRGTDILLGGNSEFMAKQELKKLGSRANSAVRESCSPAHASICVSPTARMPQSAPFRQSTTRCSPSSGASTFVPAPRISGSISISESSFLHTESSVSFFGKTITAAPPPMRNEVCSRSGSSVLIESPGSAEAARSANIFNKMHTRPFLIVSITHSP